MQASTRFVGPAGFVYQGVKLEQSELAPSLNNCFIDFISILGLYAAVL